MTTKPYFLGFCLFALIVAGCGENSSRPAEETWQTPGEKAPKLGALQYRVVTQGTLKEDTQGLFGIGDIVFTKALPKDNLYTLTFSLEDRGSLSILSNSDEKLESGLKVTFLRIDKTLRVEVETSRSPRRFLGHDETQKIAPLRLDPTKPMTIELDVHAHGHFQMRANGDKSPQIGFREVKDGLFAGLILHGAKVTNVKVGPASRHRR